MLRGLLDSAGILAVVRDDMLSSVNPFLQPIIGGAKLAVRAADAELARDIVRSAGVIPGPGPEEPVDIPEEEWAAPPKEGQKLPAPARSAGWSGRAMLSATFVAALVLVLLRCTARAGEW